MATTSVQGPELVDFWRKGDRPGTPPKGHSPWLTNMRLFNRYRPDLLPDVRVFADALAHVVSLGLPLLVSGWADQVARRSKKITHEFVERQHANARLRQALVACGHDQGVAHPHQGRHTFGTVMINDVHMGIEELAILMNHKDLNSTRIYVKKNNDPGFRYLEDGQPSNDDLLAQLTGR